MHECYNPYAGKITQLNGDGSGVIESIIHPKEHFLFTPEVTRHDTRGPLAKDEMVTFTLYQNKAVACIYLLR